MEQQPTSKCWIFGDESGDIGKNRFFAIGTLGTRNPRELERNLKEIRKRTHFKNEVGFKLNDKRQALCAIRWMDWFFSGQNIAKFRILIKDSECFDVSYFKDNRYYTTASNLAYSESYREVLSNFSDFGNDYKYFIYNQISLSKMKVDEYLEGKINGLEKENCFQASTREKKPHSEEFKLHSELLQLCDLFSGSFRGLCNALNEVGINKSWVKRMFQLNLLYHLPELKTYVKERKNFYWHSFQPYENQIFTVYYWHPRKG
jgi:hypothetical protein